MFPFSYVPDETTWRFDKIEEDCPDRAKTLKAAGSPAALLEALQGALDKALKDSSLRIGREQKEQRADDRRAVVQFHLGIDLYDWFFNARTGYRAHFRGHYKYGLRFESEIIEGLRLRLDDKLPDTIYGRELSSEFEDCGPAQIPKMFLNASLARYRYLPKVWFCTRRIRLDGGLEELRPSVTGPKILLDEDDCWPAPYPEDDSAWLDVKGAFLGRSGPYQPKGPMGRAKKLHVRGTA
jgi:hypothetical protein